jgi:hypothetical protein
MEITFQLQKEVQEIAQEPVETGLGLGSQTLGQKPYPWPHMFHEKQYCW